jgi:electron transfer flavoprotein alpha subunit
MRIAVLAKQIPRPAELRMVDGRLVRDGVGLETNAYCRRANARAVDLAGPGGEVVIFTMGPPSAELTVREMIACGAARGVLVSDPALAGSDTLITARVLAAAIRREGPFDVILSGAYSLDSETGHVGVQLAEFLGLAFIGPCRRLDVIDGVAVATLESEGGFVDVEVLLPAVASAAERLCSPSKAPAEAIAAVPADRVTVVTAADLGLGPGEVGLDASPTRVGAQVRSLVGAGRMRLVSSSVEQAISLIGALAETSAGDRPRPGEPAVPVPGVSPPAVSPLAVSPLAVSTAPAPPADSHAAPVWCVLDPAAEHMDRGMLHAVAAIAHGAGRPAVAVVAGAVYGLGEQVDEILCLSGPSAPQDWLGPLTARLRLRPPRCVIIEGTAWGREVAARIAARMNWGLVGDAVDLTLDGGDIIAWKAAFSGQAVVPVTSSSPALLVTVRPGLLSGPPAQYARRIARRETLATVSLSKVVASSGWDMDPDRRELSRARRLVIVGAGVDPGEYGAVEELRTLLGAGPLGATRKVTDRGWLPRSRQIGLTGRSVAPELVVSIGASGGFNHSVGFRRANRVIAVNSDPGAPIFEQADVGIVGDWREAVARLCDVMRSRSGRLSPVGPQALAQAVDVERGLARGDTGEDPGLLRRAGMTGGQDGRESPGLDRHHPVAVADDDVTTPDHDAAEHHRRADRPEPVRSLGRAPDAAPRREHGEAECDHLVRVPDAAADDEPRDPARHGRPGQDLAEVAELAGAARLDDQHVAGARGADRPVHGQVVAGRAGHRERLAADGGRHVEGRDLRGERAAAAARLVQRRGSEGYRLGPDTGRPGT